MMQVCVFFVQFSIYILQFSICNTSADIDPPSKLR